MAKKNKRRSLWPYILVSLLILIIISALLNSKRRGKSYLINESFFYSHENGLEGLVIRDEQVLPYRENSIDDEYLNRLLSRGTDLEGQEDSSEKDKIRGEISSIEKEILKLEKKKEGEEKLEDQPPSSSKQQANPIDGIIDSIRSEKYKTSRTLLRDFSEGMKASDEDLESTINFLKVEKNNLENLYKSSDNKTPYTGFLVKGLDGYEQIFRVTDIKKIRASDYILRADGGPEEERNGKYKLVKNPKWYLSIVVPIYDEIYFKEGDDFKFKYGSKEYQGRVYSAETYEKDQSLIIEMMDDLPDFLTQRSIDLSVIYPEEKAIRIPKSSLVEKGGKRGVYRLKRLDEKDFVPVEVLSEEGDYLIVKADEEGPQVYDRIILNR